MPLTSAYIPGVAGLDTESPQDSRQPNSLLDCSNVVISKANILESRHGHQIKLKSLFTFEDVNVNLFLGNFRWTLLAYDGANLIARRYSTASQFWNGVGSTDTLVTGFPRSVFAKPVTNRLRTFNHDDRIFAMSDSGMFVQAADYSYPSWVNNNLTSVIATFQGTVIRDTTGTSVSNKNWLPLGFAIDVVAVVEEETKLNEAESRIINTTTSKRLTLKVLTPFAVETTSDNFYLPRLSPIKVLSAAVTPQKFLQIYRTEAYPFFTEVDGLALAKTPPPLTFYPAIPKLKITSTNQDFVNINLDVNDNGITQFAPLYLSDSQEGQTSQSVPPPPSEFVSKFKNYAIYSRFRSAIEQQFTLTTLPVLDEALNFRMRSANNAISQEVNLQVNVAANPTNIGTSLTSGFSGSQLEFRSTKTSEIIQRRIRIPVGFVSPSSVRPYCQVSLVAVTNRSTASQNIFNLMCDFNDSGKPSDTTPFAAKGIAAFTDATGALLLLATYESLDKTTNANKLNFINCSSIGQNISSFTPGNGATGNLSLPIVYVFFIAGSNAETLPLYEIPLSLSLSLLPLQGAAQYACAQVTRLDPSLSSFFRVPTESVMAAHAAFLGPANRAYAQLLDDTVKTIVDDINFESATTRISAYKLPDTGAFVIRAEDPRYEILEANSGSVITDPPLTGSYTTVATSEAIENGVVISRFNNPEVTTRAQVLSPLKIGNSGKIVGQAASTEDFFVFKDEGIFRIVLEEGQLNPVVSSVSLIDSTTQCQSEGSIQEMNEVIYFLSQKGFIAATSSRITNISRNIESEVKKALSQCLNANLSSKIRSFANEFKRLYGCYIPTSATSGVTYVYDAYTDNWTKWRLPLDTSWVFADGQIFSTGKIKETGTTVYRQDVYTDGDPKNPADQYDLQLPVNGSFPPALVSGTTYEFPASAFTATAIFSNFGEVADNWTQGLSITPDGMYPVTFTKNGSLLRITYNPLYLPPNPTQVVRIDIGVQAFLVFNSFIGNSPEKMKQFSEFQVHTDASASLLSRSFKTDTVANFTSPKFWTYTNTNVTIYRALLPIEAARGRFLLRQLAHEATGEILSITGQTIVAKDTQSFRNQRDV